MAAKKWMGGAFKNAHGQLHRHLGVPLDKPIPVADLRKAVREGGIWAKRAQLVLNADHAMRH